MSCLRLISKKFQLTFQKFELPISCGGIPGIFDNSSGSLFSNQFGLIGHLYKLPPVNVGYGHSYNQSYQLQYMRPINWFPHLFVQPLLELS